MKLTFEYDEHGCAMCPLCTDPIPYANECAAGWKGLHVIWSFAQPFGNDHSVVERHGASEYALTSTWKLECINGHVLAVSEGEEDAEPFDPAVLFGLTPAVG